MGKVELRSVENSKENKIIFLKLEYLHDIVEIEKKYYVKGEEFYITNKFSAFMEVDNLKGKKGLLLEKTNTSSLYDKFMSYIAVTIAILVVLGIFMLMVG